MESAKLIAAITRMLRDAGLAEDLAQDALIIALEKCCVCSGAYDRRDRPFIPRRGIHHCPAYRPCKKTLKSANVPFELPTRDELHDRFYAVLEVIYLVYNEGYSATSGEEWVRPLLCQEALRLGRVLAEIAPQEPEVHGLVALMAGCDPGLSRTGKDTGRDRLAPHRGAL